MFHFKFVKTGKTLIIFDLHAFRPLSILFVYVIFIYVFAAAI